MTREEAAYLAGVIDGEGCLSVTSNVANRSRFIPYLSIGNTSGELMSLVNPKGRGYFWSRNPDRLKRCSLLASKLHELNKRSKLE